MQPMYLLLIVACYELSPYRKELEVTAGGHGTTNFVGRYKSSTRTGKSWLNGLNTMLAFIFQLPL